MIGSSSPKLIVVTGVMAAGKSTVADALDETVQKILLAVERRNTAVADG